MPSLDIGDALLRSKSIEVTDDVDCRFSMVDVTPNKTPTKGSREGMTLQAQQYSPSMSPSRYLLHSPSLRWKLSHEMKNALDASDSLPTVPDVADQVHLDGSPAHRGDALVGVVDTTFNLISAILGAGLLTVPYSFELCGWFAGVFYIFMSSVAAYTCILIKACMDRADSLPNPHNEPLDWPFLGYVAFGKAGKRVVGLCFFGELWFVLMSFLVVNGSNLNVLLDGLVSKTFIIAGSGAISFLLLFVPVWVLTYFSAIGFVAMAFTIVFVGWTGLLLPDFPPAGSFKTIDLTQLNTVAGQALFCNVAHAVVPSIFSQMKSRRQVPCTTVTSFSVCAFVYLLGGVLGYVFFAGSMHDNIIANIGKDWNGHPISGLQALPVLASAAFAIKLQLTFPLLAAPLIVSLESTMQLKSRFADEATQLKLVMCAFRAFFMTGTTWVAVLLQDRMANCISLTGSLFATCTCFIFPCSFYWSLHRQDLSVRKQAMLGLLLFMGLYFQIGGVIKNISDMTGF